MTFNIERKLRLAVELSLIAALIIPAIEGYLILVDIDIDEYWGGVGKFFTNGVRRLARWVKR